MLNKFAYMTIFNNNNMLYLSIKMLNMTHFVTQKYDDFGKLCFCFCRDFLHSDVRCLYMILFLFLITTNEMTQKKHFYFISKGLLMIYFGVKRVNRKCYLSNV